MAVCLVAMIGVTSFLVARCTAPDDLTEPESSFPEVPATDLPEQPSHLALDAPEDFLGSLRDLLGTPLNVRRIVIYDTYAFAEVQDREQPNHLDEYDYRDGVLDPISTPVAAGRPETWEHEVFPLEAVRAETIRELSAAALEEFDELEHPQISYLAIERIYDPESGVDDGPVQITVYVNDPIRGGSGTIVADGRGEFISVDRY
jgi:hypothetical protein